MPRVKLRNGLFINCDILDLTDPWSSPDTIIFHHGLGKKGIYWYGWRRALASKFRLVAIDMLGCGRSSKPREHEWTLENYAQDTIDVLDGLGIERAHFVGEGMGGCVGLFLGARRPSRLETLVLSATPYRPAEGTADLARRSKRIAQGGLVEFVDESLPERMDWSRFPEAMYQWFREQRLSASPRIMSEQMLAQDSVDLEWALPLIEVPTLLIIPGASPAKSDRQMYTMAEHIPHNRVAEFKEERQWVTFSRPEDCAAALVTFVEDVKAGRLG